MDVVSPSLQVARVHFRCIAPLLVSIHPFVHPSIYPSSDQLPLSFIFIDSFCTLYALAAHWANNAREPHHARTVRSDNYLSRVNPPTLFTPLAVVYGSYL